MDNGKPNGGDLISSKLTLKQMLRFSCCKKGGRGEEGKKGYLPEEGAGRDFSQVEAWKVDETPVGSGSGSGLCVQRELL
ncbi:hypothetical protein V6N13_012375 [Hibiscus sabdariffa]|uniref:Uncharacterized protein n=1 Tax=Hibiscus sabdariffa TaxID=183260 RepID=A0ABR2SEY5_9ROSI